MASPEVTGVLLNRVGVESLSRRTALKGFGAAGAAAIIVGRLPTMTWAQDASPAAAGLEEYPEIEIVAHDHSFELPAEIAGGLTRITLVNEGAEDHHAIFIRLGDDVTADAVDAAASDPNFGPMLGLGEILGGPNGAASGGGRATVILDLAPGNYLVVCLIPDAEGIPHYMHGMIAPLSVTESASSLDAPAADLTVDLVDFAFDHIPSPISSGQQVWEVINVGEEPHELVVLKLAPGVNFEMFQGMMGGEGAAPPAASPAGEDHESHTRDEASPAAGVTASPAAMGPPFTPETGIAPMNPGFTNWLVPDFEPGEYVAICFVPSPAMGGAPHFALGMLMPFTVE